ncbi:energy coupling factor transporter S component ThiW [Bacillus canaveralius]|uniref:energy coupling factor transporter S component ThiW n=1 Tax=Bacillus canaveralius TaxID=1403243 RepID=UPI000F798C86|nr:energy coupling factor transporter S component ThiW [Bacillus canaveralius]RSK44891.1 energy coupling factor transporter S component ThiW [Bacillus canaveralius]
MGKTRKLTLTALLVAVGTLTSHAFFIPIGFAKVFPMQHFINVLSAVLLGPYYAVMQAFTVSLLRNMLGTGSVFAFPGSMIGACLASWLFMKTKKTYMAFAGEVVGTGIIGAFACYPIAVLLLGQDAALFGFIPAFVFSSLAGAAIGLIIVNVFLKKVPFGRDLHENSTHNSRF